MGDVTRRAFIGTAGVIAGAGLGGFAGRAQPDGYGAAEGPVGSSFPTTDPALAREMVLSCHVRADRVRELLELDRSLCLAAWDWGFGDWESALGAASHMGDHEIAGMLIDAGVRPNLFTMAMMDHVDAVRGFCEAVPGAQSNLGPHGISLMGHARNGKAERVVEYLEELGGADGSAPGEMATDDSLDRFVGEYRFGDGEDERVLIARGRGGWLGIERPGGSNRRLRRLSETEFSPSGGPHVRVRFGGTGEVASDLRITGGVADVSATRIPG